MISVLYIKHRRTKIQDGFNAYMEAA